MAFWVLPSVLMLLLVSGGAVGAHTGALDPAIGFRGFCWGLWIAAGSVALFGLAALLEPLRDRALRALVLPLVVLLAGGLPNLALLRDPEIQDVTTDPDDTLQFVPDVAARPGGEPAIPRTAVLAEQRHDYPDIAPLNLSATPADAFQRAAEVARAMPGWRVTSVDAVRGVIQAYERTWLFRFRDDVIIRVAAAPDGPGVRIDVRSRSRIGASEPGANAARVRAYLAAYRKS